MQLDKISFLDYNFKKDIEVFFKKSVCTNRKL